VELDAASSGVNPLHHQLGFAHDLPAAITRFLIARTTPDAQDVVVGETPIRELFLDHETKRVRFHASPRRLRIRACHIHRGLGATAPTRKAGVQATAFCGSTTSMSIGPWYHPRVDRMSPARGAITHPETTR
jgi:hypothetical protein